MAWHASQVAASTRVETVVNALTGELKEFRHDFKSSYDGFDSRLRYVERMLDIDRYASDVIRNGEHREFFARSDERLRQIMTTVVVETLAKVREETP